MPEIGKIKMNDFNWLNSEPSERLNSAIYDCTQCAKKVAYGNNYCRHCGIKYTPAMCAQMKTNLTILGDKNFKHLVIVMLILLVIVLALVLS